MATTSNAYLRSYLFAELLEAYAALQRAPIPAGVEVQPTDRPECGDYSSNLALLAARACGTPPRKLAEDLRP
ncbi:MAG: hypothetical protein PHU43_09740, partial [Candidatus Bipolaricaulis sp.]|nr:hypothetical protein [Candidatus Bipolaricaulis sp.]